MASFRLTITLPSAGEMIKTCKKQILGILVHVMSNRRQEAGGRRQEAGVMFLEAGSLNCFKFHLNITLIGKNWTSSHENPNKAIERD